MDDIFQNLRDALAAKEYAAILYKMVPKIIRSGKINATAAYELSRLPEQQQAQEMQKFRESGSVEIQDVKEHRKRGRPRKSETGQREQAQPEESKSAQRPEPGILEQGQRPEQTQDPGAEIIRQLRAIADDFENGNDGSPFDICGVCREAADLIEGRLRE